MKSLIFAALLTVSAFAAEELTLKNYVKMQEALAGDNFQLALSAHKVICEHDLKSFKKNYKDCNKSFKDIESLRNSFKTLSEVFILNGNKKEMASLKKAHCPMAEASWLQKDGKIANPYYGKVMLECGEFK